MARKSKADQQREANERRELRHKQLAQLRASNEMLEEAKENIIKHYGKGSKSAEDYIKQIDYAKEGNVQIANESLLASKEEMESAEYNEVNEVEKEKYYERLANLGKSDEFLHIKDLTVLEPMVKSGGKNTKLDELKAKLNKIKMLSFKKNEETEIEQNEQVAETKTTIAAEQDTDNSNDNKSESENSVTEIHSIEEYKDVQEKERPYRCTGFDPRDVPPYVQYDIIPLPSKGECYAHKKNCLPVAYLTAADENIIASPNMYNNGNLIDILLERKILDKSIRVADLTKGDRDAVILWLRATAYGPDYPIIARYEGKEFESTVDLSKLKYVDFNLKGDENGYFDYTTTDGDNLKFKFLTAQEEEDILQANKRNYTAINTHDVVELGKRMLVSVKAIDDKNVESVAEAIEGIQEWASDIGKKTGEVDSDLVYNNAVTSRMCAYTMSVNGNTDRVFIKNYIENMRSSEARAYREYIGNNIPCVDFNIEVEIPESMGGGSFTTFLPIGESAFINIK